MNKISKLFEEHKSLNTETFNNLTPVMKEAVGDMFKIIENKGNLLVNVENAIDKVAEFHNIDKEELYQYIEKEVLEQLGEK